MRKDSPCLHCENSGTVHTRCNGYNDYAEENRIRNKTIMENKLISDGTYNVRQHRFKGKVGMK